MCTMEIFVAHQHEGCKKEHDLDVGLWKTLIFPLLSQKAMLRRDVICKHSAETMC